MLNLYCEFYWRIGCWIALVILTDGKYCTPVRRAYMVLASVHLPPSFFTILERSYLYQRYTSIALPSFLSHPTTAVDWSQCSKVCVTMMLSLLGRWYDLVYRQQHLTDIVVDCVILEEYAMRLDLSFGVGDAMVCDGMSSDVGPLDWYCTSSCRQNLDRVNFVCTHHHHQVVSRIYFSFIVAFFSLPLILVIEYLFKHHG